MTVHVRDLPDKLGRDKARAAGVFLYCMECQTEASAHAGGYFMLPDGYVFICCGFEMMLATHQTSISQWKGAKS